MSDVHIHDGPQDRWFLGNEWQFKAQDDEGDLLICIDDCDWMHLKADPSTHEDQDDDTAALLRLATIAASVKAVGTRNDGRRANIMLR